VKPIFRCLKGREGIGLIFKDDSQCSLVGFVDFEYVANLNARWFSGNYIFMIGKSFG